jgi:capsular exopolysaccharide synthesis family protein
MSKFFEALEQAERDQALRRDAGRPATIEPEPPSAARGEAARPTVPDPSLDVFAEPREEPASAPGESGEGVDGHLVSLLAPASFAAERFRGLRHLVEQWHRTSGQSVVAISSPTGRDGKTTTAVNLAGALGQAPDGRVLLVEADFRRPMVARYLSLDDGGEGRGLVDLAVSPDLSFEQAVRECPAFNLSVLPAGGRPIAPYEVLKAPGFERVLLEARQRYQFIIIDTPPLLSAPDCRVIAKCADAFLLVVAAHRTPRGLVEEALGLIDPEKLLGIVFNGDDAVDTAYYASDDSRRTGNESSWWTRLVGSFDRADGGRSQGLKR